MVAFTHLLFTESGIDVMLKENVCLACLTCYNQCINHMFLCHLRVFIQSHTWLQTCCTIDLFQG